MATQFSVAENEIISRASLAAIPSELPVAYAFLDPCVCLGLSIGLPLCPSGRLSVSLPMCSLDTSSISWDRMTASGPEFLCLSVSVYVSFSFFHFLLLFPLSPSVFFLTLSCLIDLSVFSNVSRCPYHAVLLDLNVISDSILLPLPLSILSMCLV